MQAGPEPMPADFEVPVDDGGRPPSPAAGSAHTGSSMGSGDEEYQDAREYQSDRSTSSEGASPSAAGTECDAEELKSVPERKRKRYGCKHYERRCKLWAPCCDQAFWCRHCHNEAMHDMNMDPNTMHKLDRKTVREVVCMVCDTRQPVGAECSNCGIRFAKYFCSICNLFDEDTSKQQFHCDKCGICRVGGAEKYFHCDTCGCCFSTALLPYHKCIERNMHSNCPVCMEYLFESTKLISVLKCGHTMHEACFNDMLKSGRYACPVCEKSACDMARTWQLMDAEIEHVAMPEEYRDKIVEIYCNDCEQKSHVKFHVIGLKCSHKECGSYNTARI